MIAIRVRTEFWEPWGHGLCSRSGLLLESIMLWCTGLCWCFHHRHAYLPVILVWSSIVKKMGDVMEIVVHYFCSSWASWDTPCIRNCLQLVYWDSSNLGLCTSWLAFLCPAHCMESPIFCERIVESNFTQIFAFMSLDAMHTNAFIDLHVFAEVIQVSFGTRHARMSKKLQFLHLFLSLFGAFKSSRLM